MRSRLSWRAGKKQRHDFASAAGYVIDRESPAWGRRHVVTKQDIRTFIALIPAWGGDLWSTLSVEHDRQHAAFFERIGLVHETLPDDEVECRFTRDQARAYLLLHVFLHELGHHVDRMTSKNQEGLPRGEPSTEDFANGLLDEMCRTTSGCSATRTRPRRDSRHRGGV